MDIILRICIDHMRVKLIEFAFKWTLSTTKEKISSLAQPCADCFLDAVQNRHDIQCLFVSHVLGVTHLPLLCHM